MRVVNVDEVAGICCNPLKAMAKKGTTYFVATSGWVYSHWKGLFYPPDLAQSRWLEFYARHFASVELNNSFYHLPSEKAFLHWRQSTPPGFRFAVKVSRLITHLKKLRNVETSLDNFLVRARLLGDKLGPFLYQIPPQLPRHEALLEAFLKLLPPDLHHVFEFRHATWLEPGVFQLLRRYGVGFCIFDMPDLPCPVLATADYAYFRFHGSTSLYSSCYTEAELKDWAQKITDTARSVATVYIYFNNDAEAYAVRNALSLEGMLKGGNSAGFTPA